MSRLASAFVFLALPCACVAMPGGVPAAAPYCEDARYCDLPGVRRTTPGDDPVSRDRAAELEAAGYDDAVARALARQEAATAPRLPRGPKRRTGRRPGLAPDLAVPLNSTP